MAKSQFKYHINTFIKLLPSYWTVNHIARELIKHGITQRTFERDKGLKLKDTGDIPGERLYIYASLFNCSIHQLINFSKPVKPLIKLRLSQDIMEMMKKNNLKIPNYETNFSQ